MEWMLHTFCNTERDNSAHVAVRRKGRVACRAERPVAAVSDAAELVHAAERDVAEAELGRIVAIRAGFGAVDARSEPCNDIAGLEVSQTAFDGTKRIADESLFALAQIA